MMGEEEGSIGGFLEKQCQELHSRSLWGVDIDHGGTTMDRTTVVIEEKLEEDW